MHGRIKEWTSHFIARLLSMMESMTRTYVWSPHSPHDSKTQHPCGIVNGVTLGERVQLLLP